MSTFPVIDPVVAEALALRHRAEVLRALAHQLGLLGALALASDAGVDTWVGPSAQACGEALRRHRSLLHRHVDELAAAARRLDTRAGELGR